MKENYGIVLDSVVALMLPRDYRFPELVLALNKIGAVFVPIDPSYPIKRIEHMLNISKANFIITTDELLDESPFNVDIIYYDDLKLEDNCELDVVQGSDFAILFTSGTTGLPKGVIQSNKQLISTAVAFNKIFDSFDCDLIGCYASFSFIASFRIFWALYDGRSCRIFNDEERKDSLKLIEILKDNHFHDVILPPSLGIPILENEEINLDYLVCAGSKLNVLPKNIGFTKIVNAYGMTEIIAAANICDIVKNDISIGRPLANTWVYILDENSRLLPVGVPGEICISCDYLTPGYIDNPELTEEFIVDNSYCDCDDNKLLYRTGDIGFYNFDGEIEIIGRRDDQLSVRGFRIESEEILKILERFENLEEIYLDTDNDNLVAYYTTSGDLNVDAVKFALEDELPQYMIPSVFIKLDKIPLNANGKIDKFELKKNLPELPELKIDNDILGNVVDAFMHVLNCDSVLIDDNFVGLGGNSLSAMNLQIILKNQFGINISSNEIIELATPLNIANHIKLNKKSYSSLEMNYTFKDNCPLSESQLNVYLDEQIKKIGLRYNNPIKIKFNENYADNEIKNAIYKLFDLYPILKARVVEDRRDLSFIFDSVPEIKIGTIADLDSFIRPFDLDKSLSRFLIIENESVLCIDCHHLIFDGTSLKILINSLLSILKGNVDYTVDNGVLREISFEENIDSGYISDAKDFFDVMLAERDEVNDLLATVDNNGENTYIDCFDVDLSSFLEDNSITYNQFFASVFAYTLSRFTGSDKVLFNLIEDGRGHINLSNSVGMFVKTLPLLIDCKNQDIQSFVRYSSGLINSAMKYDLYSFRILTNDYDLNSDITFQYNHDLFKISDLDIQELKHDVVNDLSFFIQNIDNKFEIKISFSDKYSKKFIKRFVDSYKLILEGMISFNNLNEINYIESSDLKLLNKYNGKKYDFNYDDILDAFNDNLKKYEDNVLVGYEGKSFSFGEGAFIANKIMDCLGGLGIVKQDFVALFVERSEWFLLASLGVLSIGVAYVPIDTNYPDERIVLMLKDTESKVVIVTGESEDRIREIISNNSLDINVLNVDVLEDDIGSLGHLDNVSVDVDDVACVLYTSGTTGTPKGVLVSRQAINNFVLWYVNETNFTCDDVYGMHCSYVFDIHTAALYAPLVSGGSLYVVPEDIRLDLKALNDYFVEHNCTHTYITSQVGKLFAESGMDTSIRLLCFGGMKLGDLNAPDSIGPFETYGPSENLAVSTSIFANERIDDSSIGYFISNVKGYVLDSERRRVPFGAVGELYLSGAQLTEGYLNRDNENSKVFYDNSFDDDPGYERIYKTGDMVRFLPDGSLGIVGRRDSQVKIRGNRVELGEVESVIRSIDFVEDVTVQTVDNNGNNELVAYVVLHNDGLEDNLREFVCDYVATRKPAYMVPSYVVRLDKIPLTVNGKVDSHALPDVDVLTVEYVAPSNETEKAIVYAFEKVFNIDKIGVNDDFVNLGGDSLSAIKLISYLEGYNITAADIFSLHTPLAISKKLSKFEFDYGNFSLESGCPLSESQLNIYLDIVSKNKKDSYLIPMNFTIPSKYGLDELVDAINVMFKVHPILQMCINEKFDVPYLVNADNKPLISIETSPSEEFIYEFLTTPFDLEDSLSRFLIVKNEEAYTLFAVFHHLIFDGLSSSVFEHDLFEILRGKCIDIDDSFLKISAFDNQIVESNEFNLASLFYESMLSDIEDVGVLLDSVCPDGPGIYNIDLEIDIRNFLDRFGVNGNILFTGVFAYTLSRFMANDKVFFNIIENGRDRFNNYNSISMFVNTLPLLVDCQNQSIVSFMDYVSDLVYGVMSYNFYPYRLLSKDFNISSDIIFQFIPSWIYEGDKGSDYKFGNVDDKIIGDMDDFINDLEVDVVQHGDDYSLNIHYSDKYSKVFIEVFANTYKLILHDMISVDNLSEIGYSSSSDLEFFDKYNDTYYDLEYKDVLDGFNNHLKSDPDNILVSFRDLSYSYGESAFIADMLAKRLVDLGVQPQDRVAFLTERCEYYMFSVLGILSCGAVYVPLDDKLPDDRISFILEDTDSCVVIVSDETYNRVIDLCDRIVLNISDLFKVDSGCLDCLPTVYGDLACILYTSGTTGVPKGVKITRKSLINVSENYISNYGLDSNDVYGLFPAIGFDAGNFIISVVLSAGACLEIIPDDIKLDMLELNGYFVGHNVSHVAIPTQVGKLFVESVDDTSLDVLLVGGEKLGDFVSPANYRLIESYGPTESFCFISSIDNSDKLHSSSVGFINSNVKIYVLDDNLRRVPFGAIGELYIAGYQLACGYVNRDEETSYAFINNPYDDTEGFNRLYRTGDMVRFLPDGSIGIVGRRDSQVKIRGNRVELSEVEAVIRELDCVDDVSVQTIQNGENYELVAYVVSRELDDDELKNKVQNHVSISKPDYMVPSFVVKLDVIPLTVNGKVDRRALPDVDVDSLRVEYVAATNDIESAVIEAFECVFNQKGIGLYDDFTRLGGDSISAIRIVSLLEIILLI